MPAPDFAALNPCYFLLLSENVETEPGIRYEDYSGASHQFSKMLRPLNQEGARSMSQLYIGASSR
jgi:hypothetical protein